MDGLEVLQWFALVTIGLGVILSNFALWRMSKYAKVPWSRKVGSEDNVVRAYAAQGGGDTLDKVRVAGYLLCFVGVIALAFARH